MQEVEIKKEEKPECVCTISKRLTTEQSSETFVANFGVGKDESVEEVQAKIKRIFSFVDARIKENNERIWAETQKRMEERNNPPV